MPPLDVHSERVLHFFLTRRVQNLWEHNDFSGTRKRIPTTDLLEEARARGYVMTEFDLDKFAICESVVIGYDQDRIRQQQANAWLTNRK